MNVSKKFFYFLLVILHTFSLAKTSYYENYRTTPAFIKRVPRSLILIDESKLGIVCTTTADCDPPFIVCNGINETKIIGKCEHKN